MLFPLIDTSTLSTEDIEKRIIELRTKMSQAGGARSMAVPQMVQAYQELMMELHHRTMAKADRLNDELSKKIDIT